MKFTVSRKLFAGFFSVIIFLCIVSGIAFYQIDNVNDTYSYLIDNEIRKVELIREAETELWKQISSIRAYMLSGDNTNVENFESSLNLFGNYVEQLDELLIRPEVIEKFKEFERIASDYHVVARQQIQYKKSNNEVAAINMMTSVVGPITEQLTISTAQVINLLEAELANQREATTKSSQQTQMNILLFSVLAIILSIIVTIVISRMISKPVSLAATAVERIASGDLTIDEIKVKNKDEIGSLIGSINQMAIELKSLIGQVHDSSHQVSSSSEQLAASAEQSTLAAEQVASVTQKGTEGTEQQLQQFTQVTTSIGEMTTGIHQIAGSSEEMLQETDKTTTLTQKGSASIQNVVGQMNEIHRSVENAATHIDSLEKRSSEITSIVEIITSIADQTNLLALNAAIEAARAGDQGKGFAVVADEVRKLAEQSKRSADQITEMIGTIQVETKQAVEAMKTGSIQVTEGLEDTREANEAFAEISTSIITVNDMVKEVSASVQEMAALSEQISSSIELVQDISEKSVVASQESSAATEEQLATMEEVAASASTLSKLAEDLQTVVSKFKLK
ncbi:methyl-accepting chemotaxis protein [Anaerobacillus alkaliphilus]|uniref:Methyl-accepting chemotaxis protein n=1 Tax=Anaerobacillus alkaliphilus TaxID=1548597 RepID=A0A4Q0VMT7_9BACI|nr:methyl-accepting chemotaxis protein [Anaerobacillus alkaliphilus]RXI96717.1 methyl-accepting chemotaxis protein [Anaerobacillus alkaliphilus]